MLTDTMIEKKGIEALVKELGNVDAERFINLAIKEPFDYTKWRQHNVTNENISVTEMSKRAMEAEKSVYAEIDNKIGEFEDKLKTNKSS